MAPALRGLPARGRGRRRAVVRRGRRAPRTPAFDTSRLPSPRLWRWRRARSPGGGAPPRRVTDVTDDTSFLQKFLLRVILKKFAKKCANPSHPSHRAVNRGGGPPRWPPVGVRDGGRAR